LTANILGGSREPKRVPLRCEHGATGSRSGLHAEPRRTPGGERWTRAQSPGGTPNAPMDATRVFSDP